ncbi:TNT domain-containing protein [Neobacillus cucumis]|uniref:TNT domain-containing protein n=1 Tax=Neobacillus cucumis TaxID=1740721 RepID=UPI001E2DF883|nr:TNT domain-containing protein [Neobacillus cucumis]
MGTKGVDKAVKLTRGTELIKEVGGFKVTYGIKGSEKIVNSTGKCLETRGYRPEPGERKMTRDEWKSIDREKRIEANYPKPIINERNYDLVKSNSNYYTSEGEIIWPPNRGVLGDPETMTLKPGIIIDRFGYEAGTFVSPFGVPYEMRALAPETYLKPYKVYVVKKPIEVQAGKIAPWFDEPGLGIQYELNQSVKKLIEQGIIGRVGK